MSGFGKKEDNAGNVSRFGGSFRQRAAQTRANIEATHSKKSGGNKRFNDMFKPTLVGSDKVRVIAGSFEYTGADGEGNQYTETLQYWPFIEHFHGIKKRSFQCSGGPTHFLKGKRADCTGCDAFYAGGGQGEDGKKKKGAMSKREMFAFTVWHYWKYHKIEQMDEKGQVQKNDKGEPYYDWVRCDGRGCKMCKEGKESCDGRLLFWPMGITHFTTLTDDIDQLVGRSCRSCGTKDSITAVAWLCPNEECGEAIVDFSSTELTDKQILELTTKPTRCGTCGHTGFLRELVECSGCDSPERSTIFDEDIDLKRSETGTGDKKQTTLSTTGWSAPSAPDPKYADKMKPLPLNIMFGPTPVADQRKIMGENDAPAGNPGFRQFTR
jgi:hypothetical protein